MSRTYSIGCRQCRKHIWIAQASGENTTLYADESHTAAFKAFLFDHIGHPLVFGENCETIIADWEEIEPKRHCNIDKKSSDIISEILQKKERMILSELQRRFGVSGDPVVLAADCKWVEVVGQAGPTLHYKDQPVIWFDELKHECADGKFVVTQPYKVF